MKDPKIVLKLAIVPSLLALVASIQFYTAETRALTPWKGGGFGMFASVDSPHARFVRCYLMTKQGETLIPVPGDLQEFVDKARALPKTSYLLHVAKELLRSRPDPHYTSDLGTQPFNEERYTSLEPVSAVIAVRVELWRFTFNRHTHEVNSEMLASVVARNDASAPARTRQPRMLEN